MRGDKRTWVDGRGGKRTWVGGKRTWVGMAIAVGLLGASGAADACGGMFCDNGGGGGQVVIAADSHRMVVSLSPTESTLWDQIRFRGRPAEFVWVLPVPSEEARLELSDSTFFDQLDNQTSPRVLPPANRPRLSCPVYFPPGTQFQADAGVSDGSVNVYREEVVGPYETVLIGSEDAGALQAWLVAHNYQVPADTIPTIAYYVAKKSKFMALRLRPGANVTQMQPVRVTFPGFMSSFPLKMVGAGADGALSLTLWVIAEQRYQAMNYPTVRIDPATLSWDWATNTSDYTTRFNEAVESGGGRGWVVEYAQNWSSLFFFNGSGFSFGPDAAVPPPPVRALEEAEFAGRAIRNPFVTRLRTRALVEHLDEDIELGPSVETGWVLAQLTATRELNRPANLVCANDTNNNGVDDRTERERGTFAGSPDGDAGMCAISVDGAGPAGLPLLLLGVGVVIALRRRRKRR